MTDELLMRQWADVHSEFSGDIDRGIARLGHFFRVLLPGRRLIGSAYAPKTGTTTRPVEEMSMTAQAALAGAVACLATTGVLLTLSLLFAANIPDHAVASLPIVPHAILA